MQAQIGQIDGRDGRLKSLLTTLPCHPVATLPITEVKQDIVVRIHTAVKQYISVLIHSAPYCSVQGSHTTHSRPQTAHNEARNYV
jgi:hypothetical protein